MLYDVVDPRRLSTGADRFRPVMSLRGELQPHLVNIMESRSHKDGTGGSIECGSPPEADRPSGLSQPGSLY